MFQNLTPQELQVLVDNIGAFSPEEQAQIAVVIEELERRRQAKACQDDLIEFCKYIDPTYIVAPHHKRLAELLMQIAYGLKDRIAVSVPPRHGKSHLVSTLFPAWFLGKFPDKKVLMVSHTGDLAVDFGRKVRNIIADPRYTAIFPGITLSQDSKSAGRWSTNKNGEYFACLRRYVLVDTTRGPVPAGQIAVGDRLLNCGRPVTVLRVYHSEHLQTFRVAGLHCSADHPIWTMNRGWVVASAVQPDDILRVASIWDELKALAWRAYAYLEHPCLSSLVQRTDRGKNAGTTCQRLWDNAGSHSAQDSQWHGPVEPCQAAQEELRAYGNPEKLGWFSRVGTRIAESCWAKYQPCQSGSRSKRYLAGLGRSAQNLCGFLLGVRRAGEIRVVDSRPSPFVNFLTDGDHTFFADGVLTHNCGVGAALAGRGADLLLVDDPHSEQDLLAGNFEELEKTYQWFAFGARTRLMSGGRIAVIHTRWHQDDLIGHLVKDGARNPKADQYEVFEFPAILTVKKPVYDEDGEQIDESVVEKALWPEKFDLEALERTKASMPTFQWNAQYMQNPTGEQGALIQRGWWRKWEKERPPPCDYIIMTLDAAAEKNNRADFTALLTLGVFTDDELTDGAPHIILLNAINTRVEFPELKDLAIREWKEWDPDAFIVEKKSSGTPLYQELRRLGIPVQEFTPHRGTGDKIARLNAVSDIFRSGLVWYPADHRWAEEVVEQAVAFPYGSHDDMVDCLTMALARYRQGGFISLPSDYEDREYVPPRRAAYY